MAKTLKEIKEELSTYALEAEVQPEVAKNAKYRIKNAEGNYDVVYFETSADQVVTSDEKQFVSASEKAVYADKYTQSEIDAKVTAINETIGTANSSVTALEGKVTALETAHAEDVATIEESLSALALKDTQLDSAVKNVKTDLGAEVTRATAKEAELEAAITNGLDTKVDKANVANTLDVAVEGKVLDARQGAALKAAIDTEKARALEAEGALNTRITESVEAVNASIGTVSSGLAQELLDRAAGDKAVKDHVDAEIARVDAAAGTLGERVTGLEGRVDTAEAEIENLKGIVQNKNSKTLVYATNEEFVLAAPSLEPKVGDLVFVVDIKKAYIYKGVEEVVALELPAPPTGWVYFDEISTELDLADYAKKAEVQSSLENVNTEIARVEGKVDTVISDLAGEVSRATAAEGVLSASITQEVSDRKEAITAVEGKITTVDGKVDAEVTARTQAVEQLTGLINGLDSDLAAEIANRIAEVARLEQKVDKAVLVVSAVEPAGTETGHVWVEIQE